MEGDHDQPSPRTQRWNGCRKYTVQNVQLLIDGNPQRLKGSRCRMYPLATSTAGDPHDDLTQLGGRFDWMVHPRTDDRSGDSTGLTLVTESPEDRGNLVLIEEVDQVAGRSPLSGIEPHVERRIESERETAVGLIELERGNSKVEKNPVQIPDPLAHRDGGQVAEVSVDRHESTAAEWFDREFPSSLDRVWVRIETVEATDRWHHRKEGTTMPSPSKGAVEIGSVFSRRKGIDRFLQQHGVMTAVRKANVFGFAGPTGWASLDPVRDLHAFRFR